MIHQTLIMFRKQMERIGDITMSPTMSDIVFETLIEADIKDFERTVIAKIQKNHLVGKRKNLEEYNKLLKEWLKIEKDILWELGTNHHEQVYWKSELKGWRKLLQKLQNIFLLVFLRKWIRRKWRERVIQSVRSWTY